MRKRREVVHDHLRFIPHVHPHALNPPLPYPQGLTMRKRREVVHEFLYMAPLSPKAGGKVDVYYRPEVGGGGGGKGRGEALEGLVGLMC